ncbi:MAG: RING finger domain-containing protein [Candidatus Kariarchaeaceae archaeon]|jgi:hypothetical protein
MSLEDDFDDLFDKFKKKEKPSPALKKVGNVKPVKLPIWRDIKADQDHDICSVCRQRLDDEDIVEACEKCTHYFHYKHIREWLKIKGTCAHCKQ